MDARRLSFLLLVVLLPVPAQAEDHVWQCLAGVAPEKQQPTVGEAITEEPLAARAACGYRFDAPRFSLAHGATDAPKQGKLHSLLVMLEGAWYVVGGDSPAGWMIAAEYSWGHYERSVEPFVRAAWGKQSPLEDGSPSPRLFALGGGFDVEWYKKGDIKPLVVPVMRFQVDFLDSSATDGVDPYARATFGMVFRFEGH